MSECKKSVDLLKKKEDFPELLSKPFGLHLWS